MANSLARKIANELNLDLSGSSRVTGGDINEALRLDTPEGSWFVKYQDNPLGADMLRTEATGLKALAQTDLIGVPEVIWQGMVDGTACLVLPFLETGPKRTDNLERLGRELAILHREATNDKYGFQEDNFIGSLPQSNQQRATAVEFFIQERLQPQWERARNSGYLSEYQTAWNNLLGALPSLIPEEQPSLIHGDLWGGNYLIDPAGKPWLIDPAVAFAPREMDLAMSALFGGFGPAFYRAYENVWPTQPGYADREPLYQLYYLLVHVNLFGAGYEGSVRRILQRFS